MAIRCRRSPTCPQAPADLEGRLALLIPAYNESSHLPALLAACRAVNPALIVVVDDASSDATPQLLEAEAQRSHPVPLCWLRNRRNLGKQGSIRRGLQLLAGLPLDGVALLDGDGQHDPAELPGLLALLDQAGVEGVIGARRAAGMPLQRQLSNAAVNVGYWLIGGVDFCDVQSGLRLYRQELVQLLADQLPEAGGYSLEHTSLALLADYGRQRRRPVQLVAAFISCTYGAATSSMRTGDILKLGWETISQAWRIRWGKGLPALAVS